jgi:5-methylcytosine-specific restriction protein A
MTIELTENSVRMLNEMKRWKNYSQLDIEWLVNRAVLRYYEKKKDYHDYRKQRFTLVRRRLSAQRWECYFCHAPLTIKDATIDHLVPLDRGGTSISENMVACCAPCNGDKSDMTEEEFTEYLSIIEARCG